MHGKFLLLHRYHSVPEDVLFLGQFGFGVQYLHVQSLVSEDDYHVTRLHLIPFFDDYLLYVSSFRGAQLDYCHRLYLSADTDIVIEFTFYGHPGQECVAVHPYGGSACGEQQNHDDDDECTSEPIFQCFSGECGRKACFLFYDFIHKYVIF